MSNGKGYLDFRAWRRSLVFDIYNTWPYGSMEP